MRDKKTYEEEKKWKHRGYECIVIMTDRGHRCGYVGIPKTHPLYGVDYSQKTEVLRCFKEKIETEDVEFGNRGIIPLLLHSWSDEKDNFMAPDIVFNVHGGITFSGEGRAGFPLMMKNVWWYGFDCAHAGDAPDLDRIKDPSLREIMERHPIESDVIRTLEYCIEECERLADQLKWVEERSK